MYILIVKPHVCLQIYNDFPLHHDMCVGNICVQRVYLIHDKVVRSPYSYTYSYIHLSTSSKMHCSDVELPIKGLVSIECAGGAALKFLQISILYFSFVLKWRP